MIFTCGTIKSFYKGKIYIYFWGTKVSFLYNWQALIALNPYSHEPLRALC